MKKALLLVAALGTMVGLKSFGQHVHRGNTPCGTYENMEGMYIEHPEMKEQADAANLTLEKHTRKYTEKHYQKNDSTIYTIPVVFHIIHNDGPENISDQRVFDAMDRLNADFRAQNSDFGNVAAAFSGIAADCNIEFALAQKDPDGNCHNGITRTRSSLTNEGSQAMKNLIQWPREKYLNVWISASAGGAAQGGGIVAGYTFVPASVNGTGGRPFDGIVVAAQFIGAFGRTLTHEVGHWINLAHTWGGSNDSGNQANCNSDDGVSDTPNTTGLLTNACDLSRMTCGTLDNTQNYMDYSGCPLMFTEGQKARMRAALTSNIADRANLWSASNLAETGVFDTPVLCKAIFEADQFQICEGQSITFTDNSYNNVTGWNWTLPGTATGSSTDQNPTVTYTTAGTYPVTLEITDGTDFVSSTITDYIQVLPATGQAAPISEGFEGSNILDPNLWFVENDDNSFTWDITNAAAFTGTNSVRMNNWPNGRGNTDVLISNVIDASQLSDIKVSFRYAYAKRLFTSNERLRIAVSRDCGDTWSIRRQLQGNSFPTHTPTNAIFVPTEPEDWQYELIDNILPNYLVEDFRIRFEFFSDRGNNLYIDDINIAAEAVGIEEALKRSLAFSVFPNPVENTSTINFELFTDEQVKIDVIDMLGKEVQQIANQQLTAGKHTFNLQKGNLTHGIYMLRLTTPRGVITERVVMR